MFYLINKNKAGNPTPFKTGADFRALAFFQLVFTRNTVKKGDTWIFK
jgi:hypothetical protein